MQQDSSPVTASQNTQPPKEDGKAAALKAEAAKYKFALNLPQTPFKMKAGAATREVELETYWEKEGIYAQMTQTRSKENRFLLHDGPPYLSSPKIHIGTALNKILKDIIVRYKSQQGFYAPYVPGYDGHGLPIENAVVKNLKGGRHSITPLELRKRCREFAMANLKGQEADFKRLGIWGNWEKPYITIDAEFEAAQIRAFGDMNEKGFIYKGLKPVYWCPHCETALADAEVEYDDHQSHSIYVKFPVAHIDITTADEFKTAKQSLDVLKADSKTLSFVIWTTTPWTLPANLALSVHPELEYVVLATEKDGYLILAEKLVEDFVKTTYDTALDHAAIKLRLPGKALAGSYNQSAAKHPFLNRNSVVLLGEHVTPDTGTGVVHTAPGHGMDDYLVVQKYNRDLSKEEQLPILSPLDNNAKYTQDAQLESLVGVFYEKGNSLVLDVLRENNALLHDAKFSHSYPHCWRCHNPVIYRATEQWFIDIEKFRSDALEAVDSVQWQPDKGRNRIYSMVEGRGDWCLSRQRVWGVPIPVLYCANKECLKPFITPKTIAAISDLFKIHSSDLWWDEENGSVEKLLEKLPVADKTCPDCASTHFTKEMDIMDVWFDSGITHTAVVETRHKELGHLPAELYLEGSDQHRGWFQSSLLTSVMLYDKAPYKTVLTHGFVLDEKGRKMSKSLGNVVDPQSIIREVGADVLRLWVASVDYTGDVRIGKEALHQLAECYKKVRNTVRFILGNLYDFDPKADMSAANLSALDAYTLHRVRHIARNVTEAFEQWQFYRYAHEIQYLCQADLSQLYFDVNKDILYCDAVCTPRRRAVQTVLFATLRVLLPMLVPVMPHLAEDIWLNLPEKQRADMAASNLASATLLPWQNFPPASDGEKMQAQAFEELLAIRSAVQAAIEMPRKEGLIGNSLEVRVEYRPQTQAELLSLQSIPQADLETLFIVSEFVIKPLGEATVTAPDQCLVSHDEKIDIYRANDEKCALCGRFTPEVGKIAEHPALCDRCIASVKYSSQNKPA